MSGDTTPVPCDGPEYMLKGTGKVVSCALGLGHRSLHRDANELASWPDLPTLPRPFVPVEKAPRDVVLDTAKELISGERAKTYGDSTESHRRIGKIWGAILGTEPVPPATVALMMAGLKISRAAGDPTHEDSYVDLAGYAALGYEAARKDAP